MTSAILARAVPERRGGLLCARDRPAHHGCLRRCGCALAYTVDQGGSQQIGAVGNRIGCGLAQRLVVLGPYHGILLFHPFLVGNRLLLHILDIERPTETIVLLADMRWLLTAHNGAELPGQLHVSANAAA